MRVGAGRVGVGGSQGERHHLVTDGLTPGSSQLAATMIHVPRMNHSGLSGVGARESRERGVGVPCWRGAGTVRAQVGRTFVFRYERTRWRVVRGVCDPHACSLFRRRSRVRSAPPVLPCMPGGLSSVAGRTWELTDAWSVRSVKQ
eukprot:498880-Prymnesium_polylepis.1